MPNLFQAAAWMLSRGGPARGNATGVRAIAGGGASPGRARPRGCSPIDLLESRVFLSVSTDANGWTVTDYGTWKEYAKQFTGTQSANIASQSQVALVNSAALPVGLASLNNYQLVFSCGVQFSGGFSVLQEATGSSNAELSTSLTFRMYNSLTASAAPGNWSINCVIRKP